MGLLDIEKGIFNRGKYEGLIVEHVARTDIRYLVWLCEESEIDDESRTFIEEFLNRNPAYLDRIKEW